MALLVFTFALVLLSFISSGFVIFRIVSPVLPPNPLGRKVPPVSGDAIVSSNLKLKSRLKSEFGLPNFRSLSPAAKSTLWLASLDILALAFFVWQAVDTPLMSSDVIIYDPLSSARLWIILTIRQTCFLFIIALTLLYVRLGRAVYFGPLHSLIWAPTLVFVGTGTAVATVLANTGVPSLWAGVAAYTTIIGVATSIIFGCLVGTLLLIRHNVNAAAQAELEEQNSWPPMEKKIIRRSICTEDLEALKEGSSWITSHRSSSSCQNSISAFSFSTAHHSTHGTANHATGLSSSIPSKSSNWLGTTILGSAPDSQDVIPPVPRVPSPYRPHTPPKDQLNDLTDPFHRSPSREAKSSANSWLTSPSVSQETVTEWSFPTTRSVSPSVTEQDARGAVSPTVYEYPIDTPSTPNKSLSRSQVLGGYAPQGNVATLSPKASQDVNISVFRCIGWAVFIWLPLGFALPYFYLASSSSAFISPITSILLTLSVTLASPLLASNVLLRLSLPIPAALFSRDYTVKMSEQPNVSEFRIHPETRARSMSVTVVEGRRSGDVWIARGEAVDGRGKTARVLGLLAPAPKLAVLPTREPKNVDEFLLPPRPILDESATSIAPSSPGFGSIEMGMARHRRSESKESSFYSGIGDHLGQKTQIMVAQRHYPAMATTVYLPSSKNRSSSTEAIREIGIHAISTGVQKGITKGHMRSQSAASTLHTPRTSMYRFPLTPPPSTPLPPTPPNVRALHLRNHSLSGGSGYSFGPISNPNQIDNLSAGVLPLLIPGLRISKEMIRKESDYSTKPSLKDPWVGRPKMATLPRMITPPGEDEFGFADSISFHSPVLHSTPARPKNKRKRKHLSLPSLGLGKDGVHSLTVWKDELVQTLNSVETTTPSNRHRRTVYGGETNVPPVPTILVQEPSRRNIFTLDLSNVEYGFAITPDHPGTSRPFAQLSPPTSASVYSEGFNTARSSSLTMVDSATSLTFQNQQEASRTICEPSPMSKLRGYHLPLQRSPIRKSSVTYIKSNENENTCRLPVQAQSRTSSLRLSNSLRKQNIPKTPSKDDVTSSRTPLRKLTLLANRDPNRSHDEPEDSVGSGAGTPPLAISKKLGKDVSGLRPLQLARSATAKARGFLRQNEVLPEVVVRPPSINEDETFVSRGQAQFVDVKMHVHSSVLRTLFKWVGWVPIDNGIVLKTVTGRSMQPTLNPDTSPWRDIGLFDRSIFLRGYELKKGDIVALRSPLQPNTLLVKRIVALQGDKIQTLPPYPHKSGTPPPLENLEKSGGKGGSRIHAKAHHIEKSVNEIRRAPDTACNAGNSGRNNTDDTKEVI
ncbi:hypothetical protein Clacol_001475 [Clathrus columnatus]|uniref:Peptidase S26 domain-containing protein n=1 Tax=Clathrus columnatus TaxID=1419009 RepID=A0AAV4ZZC2_9AGAM|nr:hypothetical protein Clacol_001475 [Clathrus columnatus]